MLMLPIQTKDDTLVIPRQYVGQAKAFVVDVFENYIVVRPVANGNKVDQKGATDSADNSQDTVDDAAYEMMLAKVRERLPMAGTWEIDDPTLASRTKEILAAEIDPSSGWTMKPKLPSEQVSDVEHETMLADPDYQAMLAKAREQSPWIGL